MNNVDLMQNIEYMSLEHILMNFHLCANIVSIKQSSKVYLPKTTPLPVAFDHAISINSGIKNGQMRTSSAIVAQCTFILVLDRRRPYGTMHIITSTIHQLWNKDVMRLFACWLYNITRVWYKLYTSVHIKYNNIWKKKDVERNYVAAKADYSVMFKGTMVRTKSNTAQRTTWCMRTRCNN